MTTAEASGGFWLFGSGTFARDVAVLCREKGLNLLGVLDHSEATFVNFREMDVLTAPLTESLELSSAPIYLAICNPYADIRRLETLIHGVLSGADVRSPVSLCRFLASSGINIQNYWLTTDFEIYQDSESEISEFEGILGDDQSRRLFREIIAYRSNGLISELPSESPLTDQYLPSGLETPPAQLRMIELGSCGGENLFSFIENRRIIEQSFAFEPDLKNFQKLVHQIEILGLTDLIALPLAAWDSTRQLRFSGEGGTNSSINPTGDTVVQAIALDDFVPTGLRINYIKMDIEGAEPNALRGSFKTILKNLPHMAVCVYHTPEQLWEIGLWINSNFPSKFRFYLRTHAQQTFETVLYCIPY